jgi:hypothetical protein
LVSSIHDAKMSTDATLTSYMNADSGVKDTYTAVAEDEMIKSPPKKMKKSE